MANFTSGYDFTEHERVSPAKLHAIVEDGSLDNVAQGDLASGIRLVNVATPASSTTGDLFVESDFLLDVFEGGVYVDMFSQTESVTLRNDEAFLVVAGTPAVLTAGDPTGFKTTTAVSDDIYRPFGVVAANVLPGATVAVYTRGLVPLRVFGTYTRGDLFVPTSPSPVAIAVTAHGYENGFAKAWSTGGSVASITTTNAWIGK